MIEPHVERVLRVVCSTEFAGKTISVEDLYSRARQQTLPTLDKLRLSIDVAANALNVFAEKPFMGLKADYVRRIWGENEFEISAEAPFVCCIISHFDLPE